VHLLCVKYIKEMVCGNREGLLGYPCQAFALVFSPVKKPALCVGGDHLDDTFSLRYNLYG
jgi:hypothetical protein